MQIIDDSAEYFNALYRSTLFPLELCVLCGEDAMFILITRDLNSIQFKFSSIFTAWLG